MNYVASADTATEGSRMRDVGTQIVRGRHVNCRNFPSINLGSSPDKNTACKIVSGEGLKNGIGPIVLTTRHALHSLQDAEGNIAPRSQFPNLTGYGVPLYPRLPNPSYVHKPSEHPQADRHQHGMAVSLPVQH